MNRLYKFAALLAMGGTIYVLIELLWRGRSHVSMFFLGGICFLLIGAINNYLPWEMGIVQQCLIGAVIVTAAELIAGLVVNVWMGLDVWDYSNMPLNLWGQICLPFTLAWIPLSAVAIVLDDWMRYRLFGEERPHYTLWR